MLLCRPTDGSAPGPFEEESATLEAFARLVLISRTEPSYIMVSRFVGRILGQK